MSDEESFVILGSSPMPSLELGDKTSTPLLSQPVTSGNNFSSLKNNQISTLESARDDVDVGRQSTLSSLQSNSPGSRFTSLKASQITELQNARESSKQTPEPLRQENMNKSKLWSRQPVQVDDNMMLLSLEDCALKSPLEQEHKEETIAVNKTESIYNSTNSETRQNSSKIFAPPLPESNNLASSFIMGEINADVLKTSVYSQFPSISIEACAEDVVKLQNLVTEYMQLKTTLKKVNNTMKLFYHNSMQWKEKINTMEVQYKQQMDDCRREVEMLRKENKELHNNFKTQIEALEIARQKDREETIQEISEKNALLENMRVQIAKLEQQQLDSYEYVTEKENNKTNTNFDQFYVTRSEHELQIKDLQKQLSEMLASNLDFKDVEKQYVDELNCLKVNLTSAEELIKQHRAEIAELHALDTEKQKKVEEFEKSIQDLCKANEEQKERILLLEQQNEVYRKDFEMERGNRQTVFGEKQQILQDLRALQKKNQELVEEHQKLVSSYERMLSLSSCNENKPSLINANTATLTNFNTQERPIRTLLSSPTTQFVAPEMHFCPVCYKPFKSLNILQSHVNDCIDKYE